MYRCQLCQRVAPPRTPSHRVAIERRVKKYQYRSRANVVVFVDGGGKRKRVHTDDPGGQGWELVEEVTACRACAEKHDGLPSAGTSRGTEA